MRITINTPKSWHDAIIGKRTQIIPEVTQDRLIKIIGELANDLSEKTGIEKDLLVRSMMANQSKTVPHYVGYESRRFVDGGPQGGGKFEYNEYSLKTHLTEGIKQDKVEKCRTSLKKGISYELDYDNMTFKNVYWKTNGWKWIFFAKRK